MVIGYIGTVYVVQSIHVGLGPITLHHDGGGSSRTVPALSRAAEKSNEQQPLVSQAVLDVDAACCNTGFPGQGTLDGRVRALCVRLSHPSAASFSSLDRY